MSHFKRHSEKSNYSDQLATVGCRQQHSWLLVNIRQVNVFGYNFSSNVSFPIETTATFCLTCVWGNTKKLHFLAKTCHDGTLELMQVLAQHVYKQFWIGNAGLILKKKNGTDCNRCVYRCQWRNIMKFMSSPLSLSLNLYPLSIIQILSDVFVLKNRIENLTHSYFE